MDNDHSTRGFARLPRGVRAAARNLGWLLASRGVLAVLSLVYLGVATRTLGAADFGRFALITGASQAIALLVGFQTWQIVVRYGVDHLNSGDDVGLAALLRACVGLDVLSRSEEHTSELQSLMRTSLSVFCLKKKTINT